MPPARRRIHRRAAQALALAALTACHSPPTRPAPEDPRDGPLALRFEPLQESFGPGEPVRVALLLENLGAQVVGFQTGGWYDAGGRDNRAEFEIRRSGELLPDAHPRPIFGGLGTVVWVEPGEVHRSELDLGRWCDLDRPGTYQVLGRWRLELYLRSVRPSPNEPYGRTPIPAAEFAEHAFAIRRLGGSRTEPTGN